MTDVLAIILGGGQGKRLYPLTYRRSKPAVPIGGKYRLIDIPISNCLHAGIRRIFVLTQFNSASLNRHIGQTYRLDYFSQSFVDIIAAEQTPENTNWFQGTADAVRRAMPHFIGLHADHYLILAGDHLYRMDFDEMVQAHVASGADITIAAQPATADDAPRRWASSASTARARSRRSKRSRRRRASRRWAAACRPGRTARLHDAGQQAVRGLDGHLRLHAQGAGRGAGRGQRRRLRPRDHPEGARPPEGPRLRLQWLLGRRRDAALLLRRQHLADPAGRRVQLLPPDPAGVLAAALPAAVVGRRRRADPHRRLGRRLGVPRRGRATRSSACACRSRPAPT